MPDTHLSTITGVSAHSTEKYASQALAMNTRRAYDRHWRAWCSFCETDVADVEPESVTTSVLAGLDGLPPLPANQQALASWLASLADQGLGVGSIEQALAAVVYAHRLAGLPSPVGAGVQAVMSGIRRSLGKPQQGKRALSLPQLRTMVSACPDSIMGSRDRALLLIGFAGAFRRSELVAIRAEQLEWTPEGVVILLPRSKTDQEGHGRRVAIPHALAKGLAPVAALRDWLAKARIQRGPVFRGVTQTGRVSRDRGLSDQAVAAIVKRYASHCGFSADDFAGHSLRAGLVTAAVRSGKSLKAIMSQTGHASVNTVMRYVREESLFDDNAATGLD